MKAQVEYLNQQFMVDGDGVEVKITPALTSVGLPRDYKEALTPLPGTVLWGVTGVNATRNVVEEFEIILNGFLSRGARITEMDFDIYVK